MSRSNGTSRMRGWRPRFRRPGQTRVEGGSSSRDLPEDLQREGVRRLGLLCTGLAVLGLVGALLRQVALAKGLALAEENAIVANVGFGAITVMAAFMAVLTRVEKIPAKKMLAIGLLYEVAVCFAIGFIERVIFQFGEPPPRLSMAIILLLTFPLIIPSSRRRRILATMIAAGVALPLGAVIASLWARPVPHWGGFFFLFAPTWMAAGFSLVAWKIVHSLGEAVSKARDLGNYQLVEAIGSGGMGEVWRAKHRRLVRPAAIKLIRAEKLVGDSPASVQRFEREAQATASLRSPHTVELYDFGVSDDGAFYYVMEHLSGIDLEEFVPRHGTMPVGRVVYILRQACRSLAEAHAAGLVHRDIKPANIFLCTMGLEHDFVKVLDFGLVKPDTRKAQSIKLTADDTSLGTPGFMAPEVVVGEAVDARADIYALGCVAYWLLTGEMVFPAESAFAMAVAHARDEPSPPSAVSDDIAEELDEIVLACLAKSPDDRPASAVELHDRLDALNLDEPWSAARAREWWQDNGGDREDDAGAASWPVPAA